LLWENAVAEMLKSVPLATFSEVDGSKLVNDDGSVFEGGEGEQLQVDDGSVKSDEMEEAE
jgi:hypothetical protein